MINPLSLLPSLTDAVEDERTDEELEADAKRARIQWHREKVRNGPVKFSSITDGQVRRQKARDLKRTMRKNRDRQARDYFAQQRFIAVLRGNLQAVGILDYATEGFKVPEHVENRALNWLASTFDGDDLEARLGHAAQTYLKLTGAVKA